VDAYGISASQAVNGHIFVHPAIVFNPVTTTPGGGNMDTATGFACAANGGSNGTIKSGSITPASNGALLGTLTGLESTPVWRQVLFPVNDNHNYR
jgi:hypothetical protein